MSYYVLSFKPAIGPYGHHDPSAALFKDGQLLFGVEEERFTREKHAPGTFPEKAIRACLDYENIEVEDINKIVLPYDPDLVSKRFWIYLRRDINNNSSNLRRLRDIEGSIINHLKSQYFPDRGVRSKLEEIGEVPPIEHKSHHLCHAASAFYPADFDEAIIMTIDGAGEYDSTVIWHGERDDKIKRIHTYKFPNSLGHFYAAITEYLGYYRNNGEGKIMGLAPYGKRNEEIESSLRSIADFGIDYDVTDITYHGIDSGVTRLEHLFDRPRVQANEEFDQFHKDIAHTVQKLVEETVSEIIEKHIKKLGIGNVCLSGGVALNCKMNKQIRELDLVENMFIQPVANDGGLALGAGWLESNINQPQSMSDVYWGPASSEQEIRNTLETNKINYEYIEDVEKYVAEELANGYLVGWMQGQLEMGPRALGNRSILADPRTKESLDKVNKYVKHREEWRPFAPSILEEAADEYLINAEPAPYMIQTFKVREEKRDKIPAVLHPADDTTRPQTVREDQNPRYYSLIREFEAITGVPVLLNTSFNDHGEPVVTTPIEALRDFMSMGLDILVMGKFVIEK